MCVSADGECSVHVRAAALQSRPGQPGQPQQRQLRHRKGQTQSAQGQNVTENNEMTHFYHCSQMKM